MPNSTKKDALNSMYKIMQEFGELDGLKAYHVCVHNHIRILDDL